MSETVLRAAIIEQDLDRSLRLRDALEERGVSVTSMCNSMGFLYALLRGGVIRGDRTNAVFLGSPMARAGKTPEEDIQDALKGLREASLLRHERSDALRAGIQEPDPERLVVVDGRIDRRLAQAVGTYSCQLDRPLAVDWEQNPLDLTDELAQVAWLRGYTDTPGVSHQ